MITTINRYHAPVSYAPLSCFVQSQTVAEFYLSDDDEWKKYVGCKIQEDFVSNTAHIRILDVSVDEITQILKCDSYSDEDSTYGDTLRIIQPHLRGGVPESVAVACFVFLHEVGHYLHFKSLGFRVKEYADLDLSLYEENNRKMNELDVARNARIAKGIACPLTAREREKLKKIKAEYRRILKEARADEFALSHFPRALEDLEHGRIA